MANQTINLDFTPQNFQPCLYFSQGDVGRVFQINLQGIEVPNGATVTIRATKPSGFGFTVEADSVADNIATFTTVATMTNEHGRFPAEIHISSGSVEVGTANFLMVGKKNPHPDTTVDGDAEQVIPQLTLLVERVEAAVAKEEVLHEAEAWAVGQRDGVDVDEEDDTYQNNSKYYAEQAGALKTTAGEYAAGAKESERKAAASASGANVDRIAVQELAAAAAEAREEAEEAVQEAKNVLQIAGNVSLNIDPTTRKAKLHVVVSE